MQLIKIYINSMLKRLARVKASIKVSERMKTFTFIDLFAGIGGMRLAFERAGGKCVFSSEWNRSARETYYANFGEYPSDDIAKIDANEIPDHDILLAGFPCQPFSHAGVVKKKSLDQPVGFKDLTQGTLFFEIVKILSEKTPRAFLLENVKSLKSHDSGNTFRTMEKTLREELGYDIHLSYPEQKFKFGIIALFPEIDQ